MAEKKSPVISFKDFSFQYRAQKKPTLTGINLDIYPESYLQGSFLHLPI